MSYLTDWVHTTFGVMGSDRVSFCLYNGLKLEKIVCPTSIAFMSI